MFFRSSICESSSALGRSPATTNVMKTTWLPATIKLWAVTWLIAPGSCLSAFSQAVSFSPPLMAVEPTIAEQPVAANPLPAAPSHRFWDRENRILFAAASASSAADFAVTRANLQSGGRELNPVARVFSGSTAGLTVNLVGEGAAVVGLSYFFHRTGHHKLERIVSVINIGASAAAIGYGLGHR